MLLAAHSQQVPPATLLIVYLIAVPIIFLIAILQPGGPTECKRARRRRQYENRCYREGRTYTPRPHLHISGRNSFWEVVNGIDNRVRADGKPYRQPRVAYVPTQPQPKPAKPAKPKGPPMDRDIKLTLVGSSIFVVTACSAIVLLA